MRLITKHTDYAVRALRYMASNDKKIYTVTELSSALGISRPFLRKLLQILSKNGILKSRKGEGGGFEFRLHPNQIHITDLIRVFQGDIELGKCIIKKDICPDINTCLLKEKIESIRQRIIKELHSITIGTLVDDK